MVSQRGIQKGEYMDGTLLNKKYRLEERVTALEEGGGGGGLPDYSTDEQSTGQKWIDGKDLYFKVYHVDQLANNTDVTLEESFGATKTLVKTEGVITANTESGKYQYDVTYYSNTNDCAFVCVFRNDLIVQVRDNYGSYSGDFIVYYTKNEPTRRSTRKKG